MNIPKISLLFLLIVLTNFAFANEKTVIADFKLCKITSDPKGVTLTIAGGPLSDKQYELMNKTLPNKMLPIKNLAIQYNETMLQQTILRPAENMINGFYIPSLIVLGTRLDIDSKKEVIISFIANRDVVEFPFEVKVLKDEVMVLGLVWNKSPKDFMRFIYNQKEETLFFIEDVDGTKHMGRLFTSEKVQEACAIGDRNLGKAIGDRNLGKKAMFSLKKLSSKEELTKTEEELSNRTAGD